MDISQLDDEALIRRARELGAVASAPLLDALFQRYQAKVGNWCRVLCDNPSDAGDLAQEIFLRVHRSLDSFRIDSKFSTWLYTIARRTAINHNVATRRRTSHQIGMAEPPDIVVKNQGGDSALSRAQVSSRLNACLRKDLKPLEAQAVYLHHVHGMSLPAITRLLECENKTGAKALLVSGMRKLRRGFGGWLARQEGTARTGS